MWNASKIVRFSSENYNLFRTWRNERKQKIYEVVAFVKLNLVIFGNSEFL